jgi:hypothetical protein
MATPSRLTAILATSLVLSSSLLAAPIVYGASGDLYLAPDNVSLSDASIVHNQTVQIYATVLNNSNNDLLGSVQFINTTTGQQIGSDQPISVTNNGSDTVFVAWTPTAGTYDISVTIYPWDSSLDDSSNNRVTFSTYVDYDSDSDLIGNREDPDDDNDGVLDADDAFPYDDTESADTDGDGIGNNADDDDDNDGVLDVNDDLPLDATDSTDSDGDGVGDATDDDDDNDGLTDAYELATQDPKTGEDKETTDPLNPDSDGDGVSDGPTETSEGDAFPNDSEEWSDNDGDGKGDNADKDDDNDGLNDEEDPQPLNAGPVIDLEQYEEEVDGISYLVLDASGSYDPDDEQNNLTYAWYSDSGQLIGEEAVLTLNLDDTPLFPASLVVVDNNGEERNLEINVFESLRYLSAMGISLIVALLLALAFILYIKYTSAAREEQQVKKTPQKRKPKATSKAKSTKKTSKTSTTKKKAPQKSAKSSSKRSKSKKK